jgi:hypothetical protein
MCAADPSGDLIPEPGDSPDHPMAPWFAQFRSQRRAHYASRPQRRRRRRRTRAAITIVHDESVFLPIWLRYYSRFFAAEDIYVLDNGSAEDVLARGGFVRLPVVHDTVDHVWMVQTIERLQHQLIDRYDVVLVTDVDEIVAPDPRWGTLGDYLDRFDEEWVNCLGYEVLHMRDFEPPLRAGEEILAQRGYWFFNDGYDKAALATVPMQWRPGFHGRSDFHYNLDPDLRMIHLHRVDYEICLARHRRRSMRAWAPQDDREGWATHNRIVDADEFQRWFYEDSCFPNLQIKPEPIPGPWRGVL